MRAKLFGQVVGVGSKTNGEGKEVPVFDLLQLRRGKIPSRVVTVSGNGVGDGQFVEFEAEVTAFHDHLVVKKAGEHAVLEGNGQERALKEEPF